MVQHNYHFSFSISAFVSALIIVVPTAAPADYSGVKTQPGAVQQDNDLNRPGTPRSYDPEKIYPGVRLQQGQVQQDSDFNKPTTPPSAGTPRVKRHVKPLFTAPADSRRIPPK